MKNLFFFLLILPLFSPAQKIVTDDTDLVQKHRRIFTTEVNIKNGFAKSLDIWYRTLDTTIYISLDGYMIGVGDITKSDFAVLTTDSGNIIIRSIGEQSTIGKTYPIAYDHQYYILKSDVEKLAEHKLLRIKRYTSKGITTIPVSEKKQEGIMKLSALLLKTMATVRQT
jgi:hypothetical protein